MKRMRGAFSNRWPCESPSRLDGETAHGISALSPFCRIVIFEVTASDHLFSMRDSPYYFYVCAKKLLATRYLAWPTLLWRYAAGLGTDSRLLHHKYLLAEQTRYGILVLLVVVLVVCTITSWDCLLRLHPAMLYPPAPNL